MNKNSLPHFSWPPVREKTKTTPRRVIAPSFLGNILHHKWVLRIYEWNFQHENQAYPLKTENGYKDRSGRMLGHFPKMFMHLKCSFPTDTACKPSGCLLHWLVPSRQFESWSKRKERNRSVTTCRACYCRAQVGIAAPEQPSSGVFFSLPTQFKSAVEPPKTIKNTYTFSSAQAVLRVVMFPLVSRFTHSSYTYSFSLHSYNIVREQRFVLWFTKSRTRNIQVYSSGITTTQFFSDYLLLYNKS